MKKFLYVFFIYISSACRVFFVTPKNSKKIIIELNSLFLTKRKWLDISIVKRIKLYITISDFITNWFFTLRGFKATNKERKRILYLAAIMPLLDDLTDSLKIPSKDIIKDLKSTNNTLHPTIPVIRYLYFKLIENCSKHFIFTFHRALEIQDKSITQLHEKKLKTKAIKDITYEKGGISIFLFRLILDHPLRKNEEKSIYELGYLIQLINDMFDIHKDYLNKQQTLFTNATSLKTCFNEYNNTLDNVITNFMSLDYDHSNSIKALSKISTITSRAQVCIEQLLACEKSTQGSFKIEFYERKQLICDMDTIKNIFKSYRFSVTFYKQLLKLNP